MMTMAEQVYGGSFGGNPAENYERFFVPSIGRPMADDLLSAADLGPGQRVLDVACGTGVVARGAAERVGTGGTVAGLDVNPGMLAVARPRNSDTSIEWYEASAESMPIPDKSFDVVLCQMGLQFIPDKLAALREMRRVLDTGGRAFVTVPGPKPPLFAIMSDGLARHLSQQAASFVDLVFSMHGGEELGGLMRDAGFAEVNVEVAPKVLHLPSPTEFLWQYIHSTPMAAMVDQAGEAAWDALERDICEKWQEFAEGGSMAVQVGMTTAIALK